MIRGESSMGEGSSSCMLSSMALVAGERLLNIESAMENIHAQYNFIEASH